MVNKPCIKREAATSPLFLLFLFVFLLSGSLAVQAQNITKDYVSSNQPDGILYYIVPQKGFQNNQTRIEYDITYKTSSDSAIFNFSCFDKSEKEIDSLGLRIADKIVFLHPKRIFVEPKKNAWHYRYTSAILLSDLAAFYKQGADTAKMIIYSPAGKAEAGIKSSAWQDQSSKLTRIFTMINLNKK